MEMKVSEKIFEKYPKIELGVIIATGIKNGPSSEEINGLLTSVEEKLRSEMSSEAILEDEVVSSWRNLYRSFGAKPSKYRSSIEALMRRVLKGDPIYRINALVDLYNSISIKYKFPVGAEDIQKIAGDLLLDFSNGTEEFVALGSSEKEHPTEGEVIYKDDVGVICRCWNYREAERTKITGDTTEAIIVIENSLPHKSEDLRSALEEMKQLLETHCGADCRTEIIDAKNMGVSLQ